MRTEKQIMQFINFVIFYLLFVLSLDCIRVFIEIYDIVKKVK